MGSPDYSDELLQWLAPSVADDEGFKRWFRTYLRLSASPGAARDLDRMNMEIDVRQVLPAIRVPTLVVNRAEDRADQARYLAAQIPGSRYVELPGRDHAPWVGDADALVAAVREFVTGVWEERAWEEAEPDRVLATVLFTDIVGSSEKAASSGDRGWRELLERPPRRGAPPARAREAIAEHIARKRKDKAFRERLRAVVERDREILERLAR